jgi:hypothetical protein
MTYHIPMISQINTQLQVFHIYICICGGSHKSMMVLPNSWMAYNNEKSEKQNGGFGGIPILGNTQISNYIYIMYILY